MKDCKFCDKSGLFILPLRYAAIAGAAADESLPALPPTLGNRVSDLTLTRSKYAPRMLRAGFLYALIKRSGLLYWEGYVVTRDAFLYKFPVDQPPQIWPEFTCDGSSCGIDASMIAIDKVQFVEKIFLLFTPTAMTINMLNKYKIDPEQRVADGQMQVFDPKGWLKGGTTQQHALKPEQLSSHVPEFMLYKACDKAFMSNLGKHIKTQLFPTILSAFDGVPASDRDTPPPGRLGMLEHKMMRVKAAAFVIFDHIGVTQELNSFRNGPLASIEAFLDKKDSYDVTNQRKLTIHEKIQEARVGLETGLISVSDNTVEYNDLERRARIEPNFPDDTRKMKKLKFVMNMQMKHPSREEWEEKNPQLVARFDAAYAKDEAELPERAKEKAKENWKNEYLSKLDQVEIKTFMASLDAVIESANKIAGIRTDDHLKWVTSTQLLSAFDAYDKNNSGDGHAYEGESAQCTFGMVGVPKAAEQVEAWIKDLKVNHANIYMRGHYGNQLATEKAAIEALPKIVQLAEAAPNLTEIHEPSYLAIIKKLVDEFKKIDSAYDEWARNHTQPTTANWGKTREAAIYAKTSEMTRVVFRKGIGTFDRGMGAFIGAISYARLAAIANEVGPMEYMLKLKKENPKLIKGGHKGNTKAQNVRYAERAARRATNNAVAELENAMLETIYDARKKLQDKANLTHRQVLEAHGKIDAREKVDLKTNNYHQARIGIVLAALESIALWNKLSDFKNNGRAWTELAGSILSLSAVTCEIVYASIKSMREVALAKKVGVDTAADIVRGGWKMGAGVLGTFAGFTSAALDGLNLYDEANGKQRGFLMVIYAARGLTGMFSAYSGAVVAFSYAGPMLAYAGKRAGASSLISVAAWRAAETAAVGVSRARVLLMLRVARFNLIGLAFTAAELAYYGYVKLIADDAFQNWCLECTFRKQKTQINGRTGQISYTRRYVTEKEELEAFEAAYKEIQE